MIQRVWFGRIEALHVRDGEPLLDPPPRRIFEIKFGGKNGPVELPLKPEYVSTNQVRDLLRFLDNLKDGTVERIEVQNGLPFRTTQEDRGRA